MPTMTEAEITARIKNTFDRADAEKRACTKAEIAEVERLSELYSGCSAGRKTKPDCNEPAGRSMGRVGNGPGRSAAEIFGEDGDGGGFKDFGDFARAVVTKDPTRLSLSGQNEIFGSDGGYAVPNSLFLGLMNQALETGVMMPRARVIKMDTGNVNAPTWDDSDHSSSIGGLKATWVGEGEEIPIKIAKLRAIALKAKKLAFCTTITNELLADSGAFSTMLQNRMQEVLSFNLDSTFLNTGTGAGQPLSVLNSPSLITVSKVLGQTSSEFLAENLTSMLGRLLPTSLPRAIWVCNHSCIPALMGVLLPGVPFSNGTPVLTNNNGNYMLLGRELITSEKLPTIGTTGDLLLIDPQKYVIGVTPQGARLAASADVKFQSDELMFRLTLRVDAQPEMAKVFQPMNSAPTLSWAVALETR